MQRSSPLRGYSWRVLDFYRLGGVVACIGVWSSMQAFYLVGSISRNLSYLTAIFNSGYKLGISCGSGVGG